MWTVLCIIVGVVCFFAGRVSAFNSHEYEEGYSSGWDDAHQLSDRFYASEEQR